MKFLAWSSQDGCFKTLPRQKAKCKAIRFYAWHQCLEIKTWCQMQPVCSIQTWLVIVNQDRFDRKRWSTFLTSRQRIKIIINTQRGIFASLCCLFCFVYRWRFFVCVLQSKYISVHAYARVSITLSVLLYLSLCQPPCLTPLLIPWCKLSIHWSSRRCYFYRPGPLWIII